MFLQESHPCVLQRFDRFLQYIKGKRLVVFLDYDGMCAAGVFCDGATHQHLHVAPLHTLLLLKPMALVAGTLTPIVSKPDMAFMSEQVTWLHICVATAILVLVDSVLLSRGEMMGGCLCRCALLLVLLLSTSPLPSSAGVDERRWKILCSCRSCSMPAAMAWTLLGHGACWR